MTEPPWSRSLPLRPAIATAMAMTAASLFAAFLVAGLATGLLAAESVKEWLLAFAGSAEAFGILMWLHPNLSHGQKLSFDHSRRFRNMRGSSSNVRTRRSASSSGGPRGITWLSPTRAP